jgi:hypothetical protein
MSYGHWWSSSDVNTCFKGSIQFDQFQNPRSSNQHQRMLCNQPLKKIFAHGKVVNIVSRQLAMVNQMVFWNVGFRSTIVNTLVHLTLILVENDDPGYRLEELLEWSYNVFFKTMVLYKGELNFFEWWCKNFSWWNTNNGFVNGLFINVKTLTNTLTNVF